MPVISHIDGFNRLIYLHPDTVDSVIEPIDIYREVRTLRRLSTDLKACSNFISMEGYVNIGPGKYTERYAILLDGTRIVPYDTTQTLEITGHKIITDDGKEGEKCFDLSYLSPSSAVSFIYTPKQVEVITVSIGSSVTPDDITDIGQEVASRLDPIKAKTDQMVFTKNNELDVNVRSKNNATLYGEGIKTNRWRGSP